MYIILILVTFDDDVPKRGCARITLSIPELRIKKSMGIFGTATAENGKLELNFTSRYDIEHDLEL